MHNELRVDRSLDPCPTAATPDYTCPNTTLASPVTVGLTTDELITLHFRGRAFWLYSTGHRLGDLRRLVRQYTRPHSAVYPQGVYPKGGPPYRGAGVRCCFGSFPSIFALMTRDEIR